jgi:carbon monoxide dehydrogenase subunit G
LKISNSYAFDANQDAVWALLQNPDAIAKALPGVNTLVPIEGEVNAWRATAKLGIASVSGTYSGTLRMSDIQAPDQFVLTVAGEGQQSVINGSALLKLNYDPETKKTIVAWDADANVSGKLASIAQRLIVAAASHLSTQFFQALAKQLNTEEQL